MTILETEDIKYNLIELIGSGATCEVYKGHQMENSSALFAIKIFNERNRNFFEKETFIHEILNNSNYFLPLKKAGSGYIHRTPEESIFTYMNEEETLEKVFYEIEELAENGELFNYVYDIGKGFNEEICAKIFYDIIKSVELLHKNQNGLNVSYCFTPPSKKAGISISRIYSSNITCIKTIIVDL